MNAAIYAQYSSDNQSESPIDDQLRECRKMADSHSFWFCSEEEARAAGWRPARSY